MWGDTTMNREIPFLPEMNSSDVQPYFQTIQGERFNDDEWEVITRFLKSITEFGFTYKLKPILRVRKTSNALVVEHID